MRKSDLYDVNVPELGDTADITVVSNAILSGENNQSGKTEYMDATLNSSTIELKSKVRTAQLKKYYNGLSVQFIAPANIPVGTSYTIKVDSLAAQPYNNKCQISKGDMVNAIYDTTGFVSSNSPIPSNVVRDNITITAGNGLTGGGDLTADRTINVASADDGIIVNPDNIKLNIYNGGDSNSVTRPVSAAFAKQLNDKGLYGRQTLSGTQNLDNITRQGLYDCSNLNKESFVGYTGDYYTHGMFEVLVDNAGSITQRYTPHSQATPILFRIKYFNSTWGSWRAAVDNATAWRIHPKRLSSGDNLNNIKELGFYISTWGQNIITNKPADVSGAFELTVTGLYTDNTGYTTQLLKDYRNNNYYIRTNNSSGSVENWTAWNRVVTDAGGTMNGDLEMVGNKRFVGAYNYGYTCKDKSGAIRYGLLMGADDRLHIGWNSEKNIVLDSNVYLRNTLTTSNKELAGAINEVNSKLKDFKYLGSALYVGATVPFGNYNEFIVISKYDPTHYWTSYYFHKSMFPILKHKEIYLPAGEGAFMVDTARSAFRVTNAGDAASDGGIDVYVR